MQQSPSPYSSPAFSVREQKAIALLAAGAGYGAIASLTGLSFSEIVGAWRRHAGRAKTGAEAPEQRRASRLML